MLARTLASRGGRITNSVAPWIPAEEHSKMRCTFFSVLVTCVLGFGVVVARSSEAPTEEVVRLPPLLVESSSGQTWLYCELNGVEILSRCSRQTTGQLVAAFIRANEGLDTLLPNRFRLSTETSQLLLLYDAALWPKARQEALAQLLLARAPLPRESGKIENIEHAVELRDATPSREKEDACDVSERVLQLTSAEMVDQAAARERLRKRAIDRERAGVRGYVLQGAGSSGSMGSGTADFFSNIRLTDADIMATFAIVSGQDVDHSRSTLTYEAVAQLLTARVPRLPQWFSAGFLSLYHHVDFAEDDTVAPKQDVAELGGRDGLIPLRKFLYDERAASENPGRWLAQAELLVRWGLDPRQTREAAFWRFVERASTQRADETAFPECFGLTFDAALEDLVKYSATAAATSMRWPRRHAGNVSVEIRDASGDEIARIRGEWERLETRYVRQKMQNSEAAYLDQARRTVRTAFSRGDRDPRLLATYGLLELDAGDPATAQPLLEAATTAAVARPRAYFELAKLEFDDALNRTRRNDGRIEEPETTRIVGLLSSAAKMSPQLVGVYQLLIDVWTNAAIEPSGADQATIDQGLSYFETEPMLLFRAAKLYARLNDVAYSDRLAGKAQKYAQPRLAAEIDDFRKQLASHGDKAP